MLIVASVKGSPGVTTTALLIGALWPRPITLVEADPSGGDIALRMPGASGQPLDPGRGLVSLVAAGRRSLYAQLVHDHAQQIIGGLYVIAGVGAPEQAAAIHQWNELAELLSRLPGRDVVADLGRIGAGTPQNALLDSASALCVVTGTVPSQIVHVRERLRRLREAHRTLPPIHVLVNAPAKRSRAVREVREVLEQSDVEVSGVHHLAHDRAGADFFLGQVSGKPQRTHLVRSAHPIVAELAEVTEIGYVPAETQDGLDNPGVTDNADGADNADDAGGDESHEGVS